jgi:hypothetical protein
VKELSVTPPNRHKEKSPARERNFAELAKKDKAKL